MQAPEEKMSENKKEEQDRELSIGEHRFYLRKDNILHDIIVGDITKNDADIALDFTLKCAAKVPDKLHVLIDINKSGKPSAEARKFGKEVFAHEKIGKVAMYGLNPVARVIASFMITISQRGNIRFFKTQEDALAWLKE